MIRRNYRSNRFYRGGVFSPKDYSKLKDNMEFEGLCFDIQEKLRSNEFKDAVRLLDKIIADTASEKEIKEACDVLSYVRIYAQTLINKVNAVRELEAKLPSKTASLRRRF